MKSSNFRPNRAFPSQKLYKNGCLKYSERETKLYARAKASSNS